MKKIIGILLAIVMVCGAFALTACEVKDGQTSHELKGGTESGGKDSKDKKAKTDSKKDKKGDKEKPEEPEETEKAKLGLNREVLSGIGQTVGALKAKYGTIIDTGWFYGAYIKFNDDRAYGLNSVSSVEIADSDMCNMVYTSFEDLFTDGDRVYTLNELEALLGKCTKSYNEMDEEHLYTFDYDSYQIMIHAASGNLTAFRNEAVDVWGK